MDPLYLWLESQVRARLANRRGQADAIVLIIVLFLLWLIVQGRRVVVQ